jgi:hypothetical protein
MHVEGGSISSTAAAGTLNQTYWPSAPSKGRFEALELLLDADLAEVARRR